MSSSCAPPTHCTAACGSTAPALAGRFLAVGDLQGYVHFLSREDGSFVARVATDGTPIIAQPVSFEDHVVVQTLKGGVYAIAVQ